MLPFPLEHCTVKHNEVITLTISILCSAITANFSARFFNRSCVACETRATTSDDDVSSMPCLATAKSQMSVHVIHATILYLLICRIRCWSNEELRKMSSLHDLIWVPTNSVEPRIRCDSSARFTPPMAATSLMSSSPLSTQHWWANVTQLSYQLCLQCTFNEVQLHYNC